MPCIPLLQNLLLPWAAGCHRVARCFQLLLQFSLCTEMEEPCAELTNAKRKRMPMQDKLDKCPNSSQFVVKLPRAKQSQ